VYLRPAKLSEVTEKNIFAGSPGYEVMSHDYPAAAAASLKLRTCVVLYSLCSCWLLAILFAPGKSVPAIDNKYLCSICTSQLHEARLQLPPAVVPRFNS
jgi:hypothetical protein